MLLIAEFLLTIFAWRAGWKWYALIPVAIPVTIGLIGGASGAIDPGDVGALVLFDIGAIIALIIMIVKKKKASSTE